MNARSPLKWLAYKSGALNAIHCVRNRIDPSPVRMRSCRPPAPRRPRTVRRLTSPDAVDPTSSVVRTRLGLWLSRLQSRDTVHGLELCAADPAGLRHSRISCARGGRHAASGRRPAGASYC